MGNSCVSEDMKPRRCLRGLVFMLLIFSAFTIVSADFTDLFYHRQNEVLAGHDDELIGDITAEECAMRCLKGTTTVPEGECLSFDYRKVSGGRCQLSRDNKATAGQALDSNSHFDHYEMRDLAAFFAEYADHALGQHDDVIVRQPTVNSRTCALRCVLGEGSLSVGSCLSFDLDSRGPRCLLSRDNQETAGQRLDPNTRFDHYKRNEFCLPNPCVHGSCTNQANGFSCTCDAGWKGNTCDRVCPWGTFGLTCSKICHCLNGNANCNHVTGACLGGCTYGWAGSDCQTVCTAGEFGPNCTFTCHCASGNSVCDIRTGVCSSGGCEAGWKESDCQTVCGAGEFGPNCNKTCHCADGDSVCPAKNGVCTRGGCAVGWQGDSCQTDVDECNTDSDNCHIHATCSNMEGSFNCSCNPGYQGNGTSCTEQKVVGVRVPVVWIIVGVVAGAFAIGAVGAVIFYYRKKNKDVPKQDDLPLEEIGDQPETDGTNNETFDPGNDGDTSISACLSNLTTVEDVQKFLIDNGMQECTKAFKDNDVDGRALRHLDDAMMKDLVPLVGPRARLKAVLQETRASEIRVSLESPIPTLNFWEIPRSSLKLGRRLGSGQFGEVRRGEVRNRGVTTTVAVKTLRDSASDSDKKDLRGELEILATVSRHDNVISLIGACTSCEPLMIVVEYAPNGCLKDWLKTNSTETLSSNSEYQNQPVPVSEPPIGQLIQFGIDVASGMSHLAAMQCVHRDLAARNILLGENLKAKVSDFGLSRDIYESEEYVKSTNLKSKLPLRWMAHESLFYHVYTTQSDVWSFGVLLWEIMTMGHLPYKGMNGDQMVDMIDNGGRLEQPLHCPDEIYALMKDCWETQPEDRPTFPQLKSNLDRIIEAYRPHALHLQ